METNEKSVVEHISQFIRKSVTLKLLSILILTLLLMIPMAFIQSLIWERQSLRESAINEVSNSWATRQNLYGPILTIPYNQQVFEDGKLVQIKKHAYILPSLLNIDASIDPKSLRRGIYEVVVYDSKVSFKGDFTGLEMYLNELKGSEILWKEAFLTVNVADLRGIKDKVTLNWNSTELTAEPGSLIPAIIPSGFTVKNIFPNVVNVSELNDLTYSFNLHLQGSQFIGFAPLGKETNVNLTSIWADPSFTGSFLPDDREVSKDGFTALYKILELNRNYPQFWVDNKNSELIRQSEFGVDLLYPSNDYQKAMRSAKYAILAISLTFLTFFLVEIFNKKKLHPFQYILIGLALCLFYTLLISVSEHTNFDIAYIIASVSVISMIGFYAKSILKDLKRTLILVVILILTYSFVYITLQLQDYALIIGSIGLTLILAFTMYITRNVNWYELSTAKKD